MIKQKAQEVSANKFHKCVASWQNHNSIFQNYSYTELGWEICLQDKLQSVRKVDEFFSTTILRIKCLTYIQTKKISTNIDWIIEIILEAF